MLRRCFLKSLAMAPAAPLLTRQALSQQRGSMPPVDPFKPSDEANNPIGAGKGIHPGRVVWVRDAKATSWDGVTGHWWDDANTNQKVVHDMTSRLLRDLTGRKNDKQAWDALFRSFNETHKLGSSGYRPGREIAIKDQLQPGPVPGVGQWRPRPAVLGAVASQGTAEWLAQPSCRGGPGDATDRNGRGAGRGHPALRCRRRCATSVSRSTTGSGRIPILNSRR